MAASFVDYYNNERPALRCNTKAQFNSELNWALDSFLSCLLLFCQSSFRDIGFCRGIAGQKEVEIADEHIRINTVGQTALFNIFKMGGHAAKAAHPHHGKIFFTFGILSDRIQNAHIFCDFNIHFAFRAPFGNDLKAL